MTWIIIGLIVSMLTLAIVCIQLNNEVNTLKDRIMKIGNRQLESGQKTRETIQKMHDTLDEMEKWIESLSFIMEQETGHWDDQWKKYQKELSEIKRYYVTYVSRKDKSDGDK